MTRHFSTPPDASMLTPDVLIIGAGPSGLSAGTELVKRGHRVLVVEREAVAGGIPRHCAHKGFGIRDLHRVLDGPTYAERLVENARQAGVTIWTNAMVTDWSASSGATITSPHGRFHVTPRATILATGARERPRAARLLPGDRPSGIYTTGQLQNSVHLHHQRVGSRAVILGAELVSFSAVMTLREAGCRTVAMVTEHPRPEAYAPVATAGSLLFRFPVLVGHRVTRIIGRTQLEGIEVENVATAQRRVIACDTLITSGDWVPDHELARMGGLMMDHHSKAPIVDTGLRTGTPGVFAIGNLVHPVDTGDVAALDGRHVVASVEQWLSGATAPATTRILIPAGILTWIAPSQWGEPVARPSRGRYLGWVEGFARFPRITVRQDGRVVTTKRLLWPAVPGRLFRMPSTLLRGVTASGGDVTIEVQ